MNGFEVAIRNALERSERTNPEVRARIYQSARHALEAGLRKQGVTDAAKISGQRRWLEQLIASVETEEEKAALPSVAPERRSENRGAPVPPRAAQAPVRAAPASSQRQEPGFAAESDDDAYDDDDADDGDLRAERLSSVPDGEMLGGGSYRKVALAGAEQRNRPRRRRGVFARMFIYFIFFGSLILGGGWLYTSDALLSPSQRDTSVPNPPLSIVEEDFTGTPSSQVFDPQGGFSGDWVEIFTPAAAARLRPGPAVRVEATVAASGPAMQITSTQPGNGGQVRIEVPVDVLSRMAGKTSTIALTMQSATSESAIVSVQCQFGSLGNCERHRFTANQEKFDALFKVTLPRGLTPGTPGALLLNAGLGDAGRSIELFSVRVLPGE